MKSLSHIPMLVLYVCFLAGCAHLPEEMTYVLPNPQAGSTIHANVPRVVVKSIQLANYLDQGGLVIKTGDVQLVVTQQHRWAEPLDAGIERYLNRKLSTGSETSNQAPGSILNLTLVLDAFESQGFEHVIASGHWILSSSDSSQTMLQSAFHYEIPIHPQNYPGIIHGMSALLDRISENIGSSLTKTFPEGNQEKSTSVI